jgi:uncharacterized membrane protein YraQ (UPF0718 family)
LLEKREKIMSYVLDLLEAGWLGLVDYLSFHVLTCLVPALFIAGAITLFFSQRTVLKYFGPKSNKAVSYGVASVSGTVLAVCSCTVLPIFGGIFTRGAGLGPAIAFLYSGPAINVLAIVYSARLLGYDIGLARGVGAILFSVVVGLLMAAIFSRDKTRYDEKAFAALEKEPEGKKLWQQAIFFGTLIAILVFGASKNWLLAGVSLVALLVVLKLWFSLDEVKLWFKETFLFTRKIFPWLIGGVFFAGMLRFVIPPDWIKAFAGENTIQANAGASLIGAATYFATLTEVPLMRSLMDLGMTKGPVVSMLLADPALSIPSILVLGSIMGWKKTSTYVGLVVVMSTLTGFLLGTWFLK